MNGSGPRAAAAEGAPEDIESFKTWVAALRSLGSTRDSALRATRRAFEKLKASGSLSATKH